MSSKPPIPPPGGEFAFIKALAAITSRTPEALGLADDGAVLHFGDGRKLVLAADMVQAGTHTMPDAAPAQIACKALRTNLSDLAAMGAEPAFFLSTICWPGKPDAHDMQTLIDALNAEQRQYGIALIGGDTICGQGPLTISITVLGWANGPLIRRTGARPGDDVWVSGTIGDGWLGLGAAQGSLSGLAQDDQQFVQDRYEYPQPRLALGAALAPLVQCGLDVSDGVIADAAHLAKAGDCALLLYPNQLPLSGPAQHWLDQQGNQQDALIKLMTGGDDYELLFCASPQNKEKILALSQQLDLPLRRIGRVQTGEGVYIEEAGGKLSLASKGGFTHF